MIQRAVILFTCILSGLCALLPVDLHGSTSSSESLRSVFGAIPPESIETGILYDRVVPLSGIEHYSGGEDARPLTLDRWKQIYFELYNASVHPPAWPGLEQFLQDARPRPRGNEIPVAMLEVRYDKIRPDAFQTGALIRNGGRLTMGAGDPFEEQRVFAASPLKDRTYRGADVSFLLDERWFISNDSAKPRAITIDFDDGRGYRNVTLGGSAEVCYQSPGRKKVRLHAVLEDGEVLYASFLFDVEALETPLPHDTLSITADIAYDGGFASGEAYVYLADSLAPITNPVFVVEGFDLDNTMNWDELYALLNQQNLIETLRAQGFDAIVLNFTEATEYMQRNAFVLVKLVQEVMAGVDPDTDCAIIGASMGGLVSRYALAYMEQNSIDHHARTFISFDVPHGGANIPLGMQYWMDFFADQSADAAFLLSRLDTPAARQMLVYHHTTPPGVTGETDPLRSLFLADLADAGSWPDQCRRIAVANGSGAQSGQGFAAGEQIVSYEYYSFLVDIVGNVWAVTDGSMQTVFHGLTDIILLPKDERIVSASGTMPYDNAPGGYRSSMAQMDASEAPYGDIIALYDNHCFIPTVSSLALDTQDLFLDIANHPDLLSLTPFDQVYFPAENQEHVTITAESAEWFLREIRFGATGVEDEEDAPSVVAELYQNYPNPFNPVTTIRFSAPAGTHTRLRVFDVKGRLVAELYDGVSEGTVQAVPWNGTNRLGQKAGSGVYLCRLEAGAETRMQKLVLLK